MEAQGTPKSTNNVKKAVPEAGSGKDAQKVRKRGGWDPQKQCFRIEGVAKITKFRCLRKVTKMTPKLLPKWSKSVPKQDIDFYQFLAPF